MYTTFLASAFRSIRFGIGEAHGKGQVLQLNHLLDAGAFRVAPDGTFSVDAGEGEARRHRAHPGADDDPGRGQLREGEERSWSVWPWCARRRSGSSTG